MLGTVNPVAEIARRAHEVGALVVVDASQAVPQLPVDVVALGADFVAFTGHKVVGPTGIGVLWGRGDVLAALPPFLGGGEMIETVTMDEVDVRRRPRTSSRRARRRSSQAVGLGAARGLPVRRSAWMRSPPTSSAITAYALERLQQVGGLTILGPTEAVDRGGAISFELDGVHPHDVSQVLDSLRHRRARRPSLRQARPCRGSASSRPRGRRSTSTRRRRRSTRWSTRSSTTKRFFKVETRRHDDGHGLAVPGDHPGPLQAPAPCGTARAVRSRGAPRQPDLRRRGDPARAARRTASSRTCRTTPRDARSRRPRPRC